MLGTFYPSSENKKLEFKEFYFKIGPEIILSEAELNNSVTNGKWYLKHNQLVEINIKNYLKYYVPKYASCFLNSNLDGKVIIGINDINEITGIPYQGDLNIDELNIYLKNKVVKYIRGIDDISNISIEVNKLDVDDNILNDNASELIKLKEGRDKEFSKINNRYKIEKQKWLSKMSKYSTRFYNIMNLPDSRRQLLSFCKERNAKKEIIQLLESDKEIEVELNETFYLRFRDVNDVVHWAGEYKDYNVERLQKIKPIRGEMPRLISNSMILSRTSDMNYKFYKNNKNINFYTITININKVKCDNPVEFRLPGSKTWYYRERISLPEGPGCV